MALSPSSMFAKSKAPTTPQSLFKVTAAPVQTTPVGVKAVAPTSNVSRPPTTLPAAQKAPVQPTPAPKPTPQPSMLPQMGSQQPVAPVPPAAPVTPPAVPPPAPPQPTNQGPTYPGLLGSLIKNAQTTAQQGQMTPEEVKARSRLAALPGVQGEVNANIEQHPSDLAFQMGREAVAGRNIEAQRQSLADQVAAYAAERGANVQAGTAAGSQYGAAVNAAAPQLTNYGQAYYNPLLAGQPGQGGDISSALGQYAQLLATGQQAAIPSSITGNPILNAQLIQMAQQINPGFNYNTALGTAAGQQQVAAAPGAAQASNLQLGGTAIQQANAATYQNALPQYYQMQSQLQNVEGLGNMLLQTASGNTINPFDVRFANQTIAQFQNQLSSPERTRFQETLNNFQGAASALLANSSGQIPTDVSSSINALGTGSLSLGALKALVDQAQKNGAIKLQSQAGIVNSALQTLQQGTQQSNQTTSGAAGWL